MYTGFQLFVTMEVESEDILIEQLFGSKTRVKLLHLFTTNPNRAFYVREITRKIDEQINSVRRELANLLTIGVISSENSNNRLYYEVDQSYVHYPALKNIFENIEDSEHVQDDQEKRFRDIGSIKAVYMLGKFARDESKPVDLFIVGDINQTKLEKLVKELEEEQNTELNYAVMSEEDFSYRTRIADKFVMSVVEAKKNVVIDDLSTTESDKKPQPKKKKTAKGKEK